VIPAGGIGSRLWPLSRAAAPKFLHDLTGSGQTLLKETWNRLLPLADPSRITIVTGKPHSDAVQRQLPQLLAENLVLEETPRDSTAAIALAAAILVNRDADVIIGSFAADHVISDQKAFEAVVREAVEVAATGKIVTIGIKPLEPSIGFGYIQAGAALDGAQTALAVESFVEKPSLDTAKAYLEAGNYLWNAGMFIAPAQLILDVLAETEPELHSDVLKIAAAWHTDQQEALVAEVWPKLKKVAIDYSVAEPAAEKGLVAVVPATFEWHDVGDFAAIAALQSKGREGHLAVLGDAQVLSDQSSGILVGESSRLIALIGMQDVIVVDTPDALLITTKEHAQRVKKIVETLQSSGHRDVL
jgi:mannose-1-phosphate guanylyltransferase